MVQCACPWCTKPADPGCESLAGDPTCRDHSFDTMIAMLSRPIVSAKEDEDEDND